jgi:hypothetical protein
MVNIAAPNVPILHDLGLHTCSTASLDPSVKTSFPAPSSDRIPEREHDTIIPPVNDHILQAQQLFTKLPIMPHVKGTQIETMNSSSSNTINTRTTGGESKATYSISAGCMQSPRSRFTTRLVTNQKTVFFHPSWLRAMQLVICRTALKKGGVNDVHIVQIRK